MKFYPHELFSSEQGYELLPFKFDRFSDDEYIITNMVGEYLLVERSIITSIVDKSLSSDHPIYLDLISKHFIRPHGSKSAINLLALKYRSRFATLANFTSLHIFVVTLRCDHSCPYCQVSRQCSDKTQFDMSVKTANLGIQFMFRTPAKAIKVEIQGGEPLLNFDLIKHVVLEAKQVNKTYNKQLSFVIATTLSMLDTEILDFCLEHDIHLSSSLDGPEQLHNKNRPRPNRDSYQKFVTGLEMARNTLGFDKVSALMTTTKESLGLCREIIDEYLKLGFSSIFLRSLSPYGHAIKKKRYDAYDAQIWLEFYKEGLDYIIALNKAGVPFVEQYTSVILQKIFTSDSSGYVDLMSPSGAGIAAIVFNYDGDVYASDESRMLAEMGDKTFRLGNLHTNTYEEIILDDVLLNALEESITISAPMCSDCAFEQYCGAEPVYHHAMFGDVLGKKPESDFCYKNLSIFKHVIKLMRDDAETAQIFLRWATRC
jgi:His-Xaa-Ser system radical SAM maturase HxsB